MIPKKIHYCWLSGEKFPPLVEKCIQSWREVMPDYEIILWDKNRFDINSAAFVREACEVRKWAFAADYIRLYALYDEGGIYLDSDVLVGKRFDDFLNYDFFSSLENVVRSPLENMVSRAYDELPKEKEIKIESNNYGFQIAVMGAAAKNEFIGDCLNWYQNHHFKLPDGTFRDNFSIGIGPDICASIARKHGFKYDCQEIQRFGKNMIVFPSEYFPNEKGRATKKSYAVHCCEGNWLPKSSLFLIHRKITSNAFLRKLFRKRDLSVDALKKIIINK